jgi:hypothetical protein
VDEKAQRYQYFRRPGDTMVLEYSAVVAGMWGGVHNCQVVTSNSLAEYLCTYCTKIEPVWDASFQAQLPASVSAATREYFNSCRSPCLWSLCQFL